MLPLWNEGFKKNFMSDLSLGLVRSPRDIRMTVAINEIPQVRITQSDIDFAGVFIKIRTSYEKLKDLITLPFQKYSSHKDSQFLLN